MIIVNQVGPIFKGPMSIPKIVAKRLGLSQGDNISDTQGLEISYALLTHCKEMMRQGIN